jgi:hypothetical protein
MAAQIALEIKHSQQGESTLIEPMVAPAAQKMDLA